MVVETEHPEVFLDAVGADGGDGLLEHTGHGRVGIGREGCQQRIDGAVGRNLRPGEVGEGGLRVRCGPALAEALVDAEEEELVLNDGTAEGAAELIEAELRITGDWIGCAGATVECVAGVKEVVTDILERGATEVIGAGFGDEADLTTGTRSHLGGIAGGIDTKLLHCLERQCWRRKREPSSPLRLPGVVSMIEVASIPSRRMMFCSTARPEKRMSPKVPEPELVAPNEEVELRDLATVDGQIFDLTSADVAADFGRLGIEGSCARFDGDHGLCALDIEGEVGVDLLTYPESDAFA